MEKIITLTSDFGLEDGFVGIMKSIITTINPMTKLIDLNHYLPPFNLRATRFLIERAFPFLPPDSIHLVVVDPGVGSSRRPIMVHSKKGYFIGPDNGIFSPILSNPKELIDVRVINNSMFSLIDGSSTFDGRDIFAPAAGYLSCGIEKKDFGELIDDFLIVEDQKPKVNGNIIRGEVQYIDHFGNLISNIPVELLKNRNLMEINCSNKKCVLVGNYSEGKNNMLMALVGSHGYLEFFCKENSASEYFNIVVGDMIEIEGSSN